MKIESFLSLTGRVRQPPLSEVSQGQSVCIATQNASPHLKQHTDGNTVHVPCHASSPVAIHLRCSVPVHIALPMSFFNPLFTSFL